MRRWLVALVTAVVASGLGVAINIATDASGNVWAWVVVAVLTLVAAGLAVWTQRAADPGPRPEPQPEPPNTRAPAGGTVHNEIRGNVTGSVVQARDISGGITFNGPDQRPRG